jgi:putative transposase
VLPDHRRTGHRVSPLYAHLVSVTKYPRRVFNDAILTDCDNTLRDVCDTLGAELVEFNGEPDHVHLLVSYPPTAAISDLVRRRLKGAAARHMPAANTGRSNHARTHRHFCTPSYFAVSAGGAPLSIIKQYIENQARPP